MLPRFALSVLVLAATAFPALAHPGHALGSNALIAGFAHPFFGLDHVVAMVAVGMWAAVLGGRAVWVVPITFVLCMVGGFTLALAGIGLPAVEPGIAASVFILGFMVAAAVRLPIALSIGLVGLFAIFHGHSHGTELAGGAAAFGVGFTAATVLLHAAGIALGQILVGPRCLWVARGLGAAAAVVGLALLGSFS